MRYYLQTFALFSILLLLSPVSGQGNTYSVEVYQTCNGRVCSSFPVSEGSAVSVARTRDNHTILLTAAHVLNGLPPSPGGYRIMVSQGKRDKLMAYMEMKSDKIDIAALRVKQPLPHSPIVLSPEGLVGVPFELRGMLSGRYQVSQGTVSRVQNNSVYSTDSWIHSGMSGGPLISSEGVIGIAVSKTEDGEMRAVGPLDMKRCLEATERHTGTLYYAKTIDKPPLARRNPDKEYLPQTPIPDTLPTSPGKNYDRDLIAINSLLSQIIQRLDEIEGQHTVLSKAVNTSVSVQSEMMRRPQLSEDDVASIINISLSQQEKGLTRDEVTSLILNNRQESPIDYIKLNKTLKSIGARLDDLERPVNYVWFDSKEKKILDEQEFSSRGPVVLDFNFLRKKMEAVHGK